jgi:RNA polymerase sigma-54 factor
MSLKPTLSPQLSQRLVLTPQLRQRIEMLQMTKLELSDLVTAQLVENPVLEELAPEEVSVAPELANGGETPTDTRADSVEKRESLSDGRDSSGETYNETSIESSNDGSYDPSFGTVSEPLPQNPVSDVPAAPQQEPITGSDTPEGTEGENADRDSFEEIDFGTTFEDYLDPGYRTRETEVKESPSFEQFISSEQSLSDYLLWQLRLSQVEEVLIEAGEAIIGNLNDDGYLEGTLEEIAALGPWKIETVEAALAVVQQLDPPGVAARNLQECLLRQLEALGLADRLAAKLVTDHCYKLQNHKLPELARELGIPVDDLVNEMKLIRELDPYPGRKYASKKAQYIEPEVYIEKIEGEYLIRFNDDGLPQLRINQQYRRMMENKETSKETRDYIKERFRSAVDLLKNIEHRKQTIYRVCERIVERQLDFLDHGVEQIKPMMLKDISEDLGMHLSTVSRVVNGKYAHTPQGVIELRRFFTEGMVNDDGEEVSTRIIKLKIKKMIEAEDPRDPLTDDRIATILAGEGQKLSRRTVAKYRDQLRIPGSRERRQVV